MSKKTVIITGASSGIGEELAKNYAKDGWHIGLIARRLPQLNKLKKNLESNYKIKVSISACDVSQKDDIFEAIETMIQDFGQIDCVIANAGVSYSSPGTNPNADTFEKTITVNVLGAGFTAYAAIPTMLKQRSGQLVVISSLAGYRGLPEAGAYSASKSAVNNLFESLRLDLKKHNISVSIIRPGFIKSAITDRNEFYMPQFQSLEKGVLKIYKAIQKKKPMFSFPKPLSMITQSLYFWPTWLYDLALAGRKKKKRDS